MKEAIAKIGLEIEGEFSAKLMSILDKWGEFVGDGSINSCPGSTHIASLLLYEFRSSPINYSNVKKLYKIIEEIKKAEKDFHWNNSMGFHLHFSFTNKKPHQIWSKQFAAFFAQELKKTFPDVYKDRGNNKYCKIVEYTDESISQNTQGYEGRYRFINFDESYKKHQTVEFRIFPSNSAEELIRYTKFTIATINDFLKRSNKFLNVQFIEPLESSVPKSMQENIVIPSILKSRTHFVLNKKIPIVYTETMSLNKKSVSFETKNDNIKAKDIFEKNKNQTTGWFLSDQSVTGTVSRILQQQFDNVYLTSEIPFIRDNENEIPF